MPDQEGARGQHEGPLPTGRARRQRPSDRDSEREQGKACEGSAIASKRARWQPRGDGLEQAPYALHERGSRLPVAWLEGSRLLSGCPFACTRAQGCVNSVAAGSSRRVHLLTRSSESVRTSRRTFGSRRGVRATRGRQTPKPTSDRRRRGSREANAPAAERSPSRCCRPSSRGRRVVRASGIA